MNAPTLRSGRAIRVHASDRAWPIIALSFAAYTLAVSAAAPLRAENSSKEESAADARAKDITFDDIKFHMDDPKSRLFKRSMLTEKIEKLEGKNLRVRGFILPPSTRTLTGFVLTRDNKECCFGPGAALYDCVIVEMEPGQTTEYTTRPVAVEGKFAIKEWVGADGKHLSIYYIRAKSVK